MDNSQKVRHIPIFVEGRDEPVINKGHDAEGVGAPPHVNPAPQNSSNNTSAFASAESSSGPHHQSQYHNFGRPPMGFEGHDMGFGRDMGFGPEIPMHHSGSIFDRAKDFPVRDFFMRSASPRRSESPSNVHHQQYHPTQHQSRNSPSPAGPHQRQPPTQNYNQDRTVPVHHDTKRSSTPQRQQEPPHAAQPQQQQASQEPQQVPIPEQGIPAKQKAIEDSITKIQKIQASVLDLMSSVEQFSGANKKEYAYLDEMLTQNLLKLDDIDAEGKENIKSARREAIKCINSLISLLEAKKDQAEAAGGDQENPETVNTAELEAPTQNGVNGASRNSSYDNVNNLKQTSSNNSVNKAEAIKTPEVSAEVSLEAKVQEAIEKQDEQQK